MAAIPEQIRKLIEELKVNDPVQYDGRGLLREAPREPREAMDALVKVGKPAVEPLLELLEDAGNLVRLWSAVYAAKILGEIGDDRAVGPWSSCWTTGASTTTR